MSGVERDGDSFVVDAAILAAAFGISASEIRASMQDGRITSRCETGSGDDTGRWRLTFYLERRALRLTVNAEGEVLKRSIFDVSSAPSRAP